MRTTRQFTLLSCANLTLGAALVSPMARIVGALTLTGEPDAVLHWIPHTPDLIAIDHATGAIYGSGENRYRVSPVGFLIEKLGYHALAQHMHAHDTASVILDRTHVELAARCLRRAMRLRIDVVLTTLGTATPITLNREQILALLIEALTLVSEREEQIAAGRLEVSERLSVIDILPNLTPRKAAA